MIRVKSGTTTRSRHNKIFKLTKGFVGSHGKKFRRANETLLKSGEYAFAGRKLKKRDFRSLWIVRINSAVRKAGLSYSVFINNLNKKGVSIDRKMISKIAVEYPEAFDSLVKQVA